jgi:hypothetical protein
MNKNTLKQQKTPKNQVPVTPFTTETDLKSDFTLERLLE